MTEYKVKVYDSGDEFWYNEEGELHRENGPAMRYDGEESYYINDNQLTKEEFEARGKPKHEGQVVVVDGVEYELKAKGE